MGIMLVLIPVVVVPHRHWQASSRNVRASQIACRHQRARGRDIERDPDGAGVHLETCRANGTGKAVEDSFLTAVRRTRVRAAHGVGIRWSAGITFVLWLALHQVLAGTMTGGQLLQFLLYTGFVGSSAAGSPKCGPRCSAQRARWSA